MSLQNFRPKTIPAGRAVAAAVSIGFTLSICGAAAQAGHDVSSACDM
jgi:hypothetical protein